MNTLLDVKKSVRSLVGDDAVEWTDDDYLVPKINFAYRTQTLYIKRATGSNLEQVVEIPAGLDENGNSTTAGLSSMSSFQRPGQPLEGLYEPLYMWWKPAGTPDTAYMEVFEKKTLPFTTPPAYSPTMRMYFTWRAGQLYTTPINAPIDLLVDGRFNPPPLVKDEDPLVVDEDMETALVPATLGLVGIEAGNPGYQQAALLMVENAADDIVAKIIRGKQGFTARAGSASRRSRRGWFWY